MDRIKQPAALSAGTPRKNSGTLWKRLVAHRYLYLLIAPAVLSMFLFSYLPMTGLVLAFKELRYDKGIWESPWVGLSYFQTFFNHPQFRQLIVNTLTISLLKSVVAFPLPVLLAIMLNEVRSTRFKRVTQTISYLPHFIAWVVVAAIIERIFAPSTGLVNEAIGLLGGDPSRFFMMEDWFFFPVMFFSYVWKVVGWNSIIFLAAITSIDPSLYEAARIDGAGKFYEIVHITVPCIRPTMAIIFILSLGDILSAGYEQVYLLRTPGNMIFADILDTYVIRQGLEQGQFGYATAVGLIQSLAGLALVVFSNFLSKKYTETSIW